MGTFSCIYRFVPSSAGREIEILGTISEGLMFRILKARKGSKYVILKTPIVPDAMSMDILRREYELACNLYHPCIVVTIGFEEKTPDGPAIVMEYIDGTNLRNFLASAPAYEQRKAVLQDILDGVDYLHHRGIIHNDLKPDNIIVTGNGAARIIDFGLSASSDSIYRGCIGGTIGFSAPEILNGSGPSMTTSDIYSIGRLIEYLFGGKRYQNIVRRCTYIAPEARLQDIRHLRQMIRNHDLRRTASIILGAVLAAAGIISAILFV